jgi:hypothetical protein
MDSENNPLQIGHYYRIPGQNGLISFRISQYIGKDGHELGSYLFKQKKPNGEKTIEKRRIDTLGQRPVPYINLSLTDDEYEIDGGSKKYKRNSRKSRKSRKSRGKSKRNTKRKSRKITKRK